MSDRYLELLLASMLTSLVTLASPTPESKLFAGAVAICFASAAVITELFGLN